MEANATATTLIRVDGLDQLTHQIGVLVAAIDDVLTKLGEIQTAQAASDEARAAESAQLVGVLTELQAQVAQGQVDAAKVDEALSIATSIQERETAQAGEISTLVEEAQAAAGGTEPTPEG